MIVGAGTSDARSATPPTTDTYRVQHAGDRRAKEKWSIRDQDAGFVLSLPPSVGGAEGRCRFPQQTGHGSVERLRLDRPAPLLLEEPCAKVVAQAVQDDAAGTRGGGVGVGPPQDVGRSTRPRLVRQRPAGASRTAAITHAPEAPAARWREELWRRRRRRERGCGRVMTKEWRWSVASGTGERERVCLAPRRPAGCRRRLPVHTPQRLELAEVAQIPQRHRLFAAVLAQRRPGRHSRLCLRRRRRSGQQACELLSRVLAQPHVVLHDHVPALRRGRCERAGVGQRARQHASLGRAAGAAPEPGVALLNCMIREDVAQGILSQSSCVPDELPGAQQISGQPHLDSTRNACAAGSVCAWMDVSA
eukprot:COSAG01_NODE_180_length_22910_cov_19.255710_21_plen_362_part_00